MKFGSLFSGIGGFDLGFERAGLTCEWQVENNADCNRVLTNRFPDVRRYADVTEVGRLPTTDVICGGFPCQDLSVAGQRKGLAGERSGLWFEFLRIIECNLPRWIVIENVPGLLSSDEGRDFAVILRGLVECGYCLAWRMLDAQYDGVAQRRRRVFIVGSLGDGSCAQILFESESVSWNPPSRREAGQRVAASLSAGSANGSGVNQPGRRREDDINIVSGAVSSKWAKGTGGPAGDEAYNLVIPIQEVGARESKSQNGIGIGIGKDQDVMYTLQSGQVHGVAHALRSEGADASEDGTGRGTPLIVAEAVDVRNLRMQPDGISGTMQHKKSGGYSLNYQNPVAIAWVLHSQNSCAMTGNGGARAAEEADRVRALDGGAGFTASQGGNLIQQPVGPMFGVRRLTPRECERLQGFPDDWTLYDAEEKQISDSARYRMLGNAVAVPCAEWIAKRIQGAAK